MRAKPTGKYRSKLEASVAEGLGKKWKYESEVVQYLQPRDYLPDFTFKEKDTIVYVEVKGFFRAGDASKYKSIHHTISEMGRTFVMLFANPDAPVRKGSQTSYRKWCKKNGIACYGANEVHILKKEIL